MIEIHTSDMNIKRFFLATILSCLSMWFLAGLWHEVIMVNFYKSEADASHEGTGIILLAYLVLSILMAYMYPLGYKGKKPWAEGLRFGMIIGLLWVFPHELAMAGAHGDSLAYVIKNALWHIVEQGAGGVVIGLVFGRSSINRVSGHSPPM